MEKKKAFIINTLYFFIIAAVVIAVLFCVKSALMPFVYAFLICLALRPLLRRIEKKYTGIKRVVLSILIIIGFFLIIFSLLFLFGFSLVRRIGGLVEQIPNIYSYSVEPAIGGMFDSIERFVAGLHPETSEFLIELTDNIMSSLSSMISSVSVSLIGWLTSVATAVPGSFVSTVICIVSVFFISLDYVKITDAIKLYLPDKAIYILSQAKKAIGETFFKYMKSYMLIMLITFTELTIGMLLLRVRNPLFIAFLIAFCDILPILGTGTVLTPWAVILILKGNILKALLVIFIYLIITFIRNIIEPKIVGSKIGLHPIMTLIAMILGFKLIGPIGLLLFPFTLAMLKLLDSRNVIHLFKRSEDENIYNT